MIDPSLILESTLQIIRDDNPSMAMGSAILLVECTPETVQRNLVHAVTTNTPHYYHYFSNNDGSKYGTALQPAKALEYYYSLWKNRIPRHAIERRETPHFDYPREYFETLPTNKVNRLEYVRRMQYNYLQWKNTPFAQQFCQSVLLAFENLLQHVI